MNGTLPNELSEKESSVLNLNNIVIKQYKKINKSEKIKKYINQYIGAFSKKDIINYFPNISKITIERTLNELIKDNYIKKIGSGPATKYVKK